MKTTNTVGSNIRRIRMIRRVTQEALALESGLSQGYVNQLESGKRKYTQKSLELIALALSVPVAEFFREPEQRTGPAEKVGKKRPDRKQFMALLKKLPDDVVEHYLTLLKMECEIRKRKQ